MESSNAKKYFLYVVLLGLLAFVLVYFFAYRKWNEEADVLVASNNQLENHVIELKGYYDQIPDYEAQMKLMGEEISKMEDKFPADVREEDIMLLALQARQDNTVVYNGINVGDRSVLLKVDASNAKDAGLENHEREIMFVSRVGSYITEGSYPDLKSMVEIINTSEYRRCITFVSFQRNEDENILEGTTEVTFYSINGTGKEYQEVSFEEYPGGLADLFGLTQEAGEEDEEVVEE